MSEPEVEVLAGRHLVGALRGAVIVVPHRMQQTLSHQSDAAKTWTKLHDLVIEATARDTARFGRVFGRLAAKWAADQDDNIEFGVISPVGDGYAVFLRGGVEAVIESDGDREVLRGTDSAAFVDRIVSIDTRAVLGVIEGKAGPTVPAERGFGSLDEGVVQGAGAILWFGEVTASPGEHQPPPISEPRSKPVLVKEDRVAAVESAEPAEAPEIKLKLTPPKTFEQFSLSDEPPPARRAPLPHPAPRKGAPQQQPPPQAPQPPPAPATQISDPPVEKPPTREPAREPVSRRAEPKFRNPVRGVLCNRNHLNDPRAAFCRVDGRRMNETKLIVVGERPPLGFLVLDDGNIFTLENDCVVGREPEASPNLQGRATPIKLVDPQGQLSRAHAEFRLIEWDVSVVDLGSKNGTYVKPPGYEAWTRLPPHQTYQLQPGSDVQIGGRRLTFEAPHAHI